MAASALIASNTAILDPKFPSTVAGAPELGMSRYLPCTAEVAECACPDFCERDHTNE